MGKARCKDRQIANAKAATSLDHRTSLLQRSQAPNLPNSSQISTPTLSHLSAPISHGFYAPRPSQSRFPFNYSAPRQQQSMRHVPHQREGSTAPGVEMVNDEVGELSCHDGTCPGVRLHWPAGSVFSTYPWQEHDERDLPWSVDHFIGPPHNTELWIRANKCTRVPFVGQHSCRECENVHNCHELSQMRLLAQSDDPPPNTKFSRFTHKQSVKKLRHKTTIIRSQRLEVSFSFL